MRLSRQHGFTLLELLLYIGISSTVLIGGTLFLAAMLSARVKSQVVNEVEQQGSIVMHNLFEAIRDAQAVNAPALGVSAGSLSLDVYNASNDPTVFDVSAGVLRITEGAGPALVLTNSRVTVSDFTVHNVSRAATPGSVKFSFTLSHTNPAARQEYTYAKTFYGTASLRQP